jgi:adenosylcobinamide kinase/adenosylcobinamide-phosphate guanylyltransferase
MSPSPPTSPAPPPRLELVIGGARSGKSRYAEARAAEAAAAGLRVVYLATAEARDGEMTDRIAHHRVRRPADWALVESPLQLASALSEHAAADRFVLVDCLTLWLSNLLFAGHAAIQAEAGQPVDCPLFRNERAALLDALATLPGRTILVSNEVGWGIVPLGATSRLFADEQGRLNQDVAALADRVTLVAAGLPLVLKGDISR